MDARACPRPWSVPGPGCNRVRTLTISQPRRAREGSGSPSKKRVRAPKKSTVKKRRKSAEDASSDEDGTSSDESGSDDERGARETWAMDEDGEDSDGEAHVGRGGRRGAKVSAESSTSIAEFRG